MMNLFRKKPNFLLKLFVALFPFSLAASSNEELLHQADRFKENADYTNACLTYEKAFAAIPDENLLYQLAYCYFLDEQYEKAIESLHQENPSSESLFLIGLSYRKGNQEEQAISAFQRFLSASQDSDVQYQHALWELSSAYLAIGHLAEAKKHLQQLERLLCHEKKITKLHHLTPLYLAKISLLEGDLNHALGKLQSLDLTQDPLNYEKNFLLGKLFFQQKKYGDAALYFTQALPKKNLDKCSWKCDALYHQALSFLEKGKNATDPNEKAQDLDLATEAFTKLLASDPNEKHLLAFAGCLLIKRKEYPSSQAAHQLENLLSQSSISLTPDGIVQASLIRAEAADSYAKRDQIYKELTNKDQRGWYFRGLNDLREGQYLLRKGQKEKSTTYIQQAISELKTALNLLKENDEELATYAWFHLAQAYLSLDHPEASQLAFDLLENPKLLPSVDHERAQLFITGLITYRLAEQTDNKNYLQTAHQKWQQLTSNFPEEKWTPQALYSVATLAFQSNDMALAEKTFLQVAESYPSSSLAGDALYFASVAAEKQQKKEETIQSYLKSILEKYPQAQHAPEAYLGYYSQLDYLQGKPDALAHLQKMKDLYPESPFLIQAYYLIGLQAKNEPYLKEGNKSHLQSWQKSIAAFQDAESTFDALQGSGKIPLRQLDDFTAIRNRSLLERAYANREIARDSKGAKRQIFLEYAIDLLKQIAEENHKHLFNEPNGQVCEEAQYTLAQTYFEAGNKAAAEKVILSMLEKYENAKITRGYYLSRTWYEKGLLAMQDQNYAEALHSFDQSEDTAKGKVLSSDQKLDLWIQKSHCYRASKDWEAAMRMLSKAINEDAVSRMRLKAMYLRAELYKDQGRSELAQRQLEALSKKGGEWSMKAKEKLKEEYGYE